MRKINSAELVPGFPVYVRATPIARAFYAVVLAGSAPDKYVRVRHEDKGGSYLVRIVDCRSAKPIKKKEAR